MRFFYIALAAAATLLASTNAVSDEQNGLSKTASDLVARSLATTQANAPAKRNLRKYVEDEDSLDSLDSLDEYEERGRGINVKQLAQLAKTKNQALPVNFAKLNFSKQIKLVNTWADQGMTQTAFAHKLKMKGINDKSHRNYPIFEVFAPKFAVSV